ncbi:unnamed protein product [marine sediment metagenome]|uniref:Uncharacterized protein n=1 Tax=marine sediment metagenome TaxID=412755 RepID=X1HIK4_9ZZZZ
MVMEATGTIQQLVPGVEQIVDGEPQLPSHPSSPLVKVTEPEKRTAPMPVFPRAPLPSAEQVAAQEAYQTIYGGPVLKINRYSGGDQDWVELLRWDVPIGFTGDLHEISLLSSLDAKTRYRIFLANIDQGIPTDRQTLTPLSLKWERTVLPGGYAVWVEVRSTDGTAIIVDGTLTGTIR